MYSGGVLPCLIPVYSYMFDTWYPDMFWHVWCPTIFQVVHCHVFVMFAQIFLTGGTLLYFYLVCSNTSDRRCTDMLWQV